MNVYFTLKIHLLEQISPSQKRAFQFKVACQGLDIFFRQICVPHLSTNRVSFQQYGIDRKLCGNNNII